MRGLLLEMKECVCVPCGGAVVVQRVVAIAAKKVEKLGILFGTHVTFVIVERETGVGGGGEGRSVVSIIQSTFGFAHAGLDLMFVVFCFIISWTYGWFLGGLSFYDDRWSAGSLRIPLLVAPSLSLAYCGK